MSSYGQPPHSPRSASSPEQRTALLHYVAAGLGVLSFIWGFLDWFGEGGQSVGGYSVAGAGAAAVVGLALAAGGIAAVGSFEKKPPSLAPAAIALAGLLVVFGILVGKDNIGDSSSIDAEVGLILALITAILQVAVLVFAWLIATGRVAHSPAQHQPGQWQQAPGPLGAPPSYPPGGGESYQPGSGFQQGGYQPSGPPQQGGYQPSSHQPSNPQPSEPPPPSGPSLYQGPPPAGTAQGGQEGPAYGSASEAHQPSPFAAPPRPFEPAGEPERPSQTPPPPPPPQDEANQTMVLPRYEGPGSPHHGSGSGSGQGPEDGESREPGTPPGQ